MHFADRLEGAIRRIGNAVCVGIDPRPEDLPAGVLDRFSADHAGIAAAFALFGRSVVDVATSLAPVVKFQAAFYEAYGPAGMTALHETAEYAHERGLIVLIDGKRNDIGSTAEAYARAYLGKVPFGDRFESSWWADALTVNPYLGRDGIDPFINVAAREEKGLFVLVRTSNASAGDFQDLICDGKPIYRHVADHLAGWAEPQRGVGGYSLVGAVVGATYPEQLVELRETLPGVLFLVPGYGAQGGTAAEVAGAFDDRGLGAIVNSSRGLTFAYNRPAYRETFRANWQGAIERAIRDMADDLAAHTSCSRLKVTSA
ncbi:orotidine-5'-phosphate decarboxylase [Isosphaeraceae bacterium EP7]